MDGQQCEGALQAGAGQLHCLGEVPSGLVVEDIAQQRSGNLSVGLGNEVVALVQKLGLELGKVLNDAVVHHGQLAAIDHVRVRIQVGRATMGSPAGMANAQHGVWQRAGLNLSIQRSDLTGLLAPANVPIGVHCYASGVIAAVFQTAQTF